MKLSLVRKYYYGDIPDNTGGGQAGEKKNPVLPGTAGSPPGKKRGSAEEITAGFEGAPPVMSATAKEDLQEETAATGKDWPIWEVFIRSRQGLDHKHVGSLHAADAAMAVENARDVYTRRQEGISIWVVESRYIHASNPDEADSMYDPANDKIYRYPTFYNLPDELTHI